MRIFLIVCLALISVSAQADWTLDAANSRLYFASIKAGDVAENHRIDKLSGDVTADGLATIRLDLDSVQTGIDKRDGRMREHLFNTAKFPLAVVTARLDVAFLEQTKVGDSRVMVLPIRVQLAGSETDYEIELKAVRLSRARVSVQTLAPLLVHADDFDLMAGVNKLRDLAGLDSINPVVPVTLTAEFVNK